MLKLNRAVLNQISSVVSKQPVFSKKQVHMMEEKYVSILPAEEVTQLLKFCSTTQRYSLYLLERAEALNSSWHPQKDLNVLEEKMKKYNQVLNPKEIDKQLKEAEVTRKKFSIY